MSYSTRVMTINIILSLTYSIAFGLWWSIQNGIIWTLNKCIYFKDTNHKEVSLSFECNCTDNEEFKYSTSFRNNLKFIALITSLQCVWISFTNEKVPTVLHLKVLSIEYLLTMKGSSSSSLFMDLVKTITARWNSMVYVSPRNRRISLVDCTGSWVRSSYRTRWYL